MYRCIHLRCPNAFSNWSNGTWMYLNVWFFWMLGKVGYTVFTLDTAFCFCDFIWFDKNNSNVLVLHWNVNVMLCYDRHAGYSYSGRAAAYAFGNIDPSNMCVRLFLIPIYPLHRFFQLSPKMSVDVLIKIEWPFTNVCLSKWKGFGSFNHMALDS